MSKDLKQLYREVILQHNKDPFHYEKIENADHVIQAYNPVCGDKFTLFLNVKDGVIVEAHFHGYGCAISKASTSVLVQRLEGLPLEAAGALCRDFFQYVSPEKEGLSSGDETFAAFAGARQFPGRLQCATLAWESLEKYLESF